MQGRRVATGWAVVDMSTQLLSEVVAETGASPMSFYEVVLPLDPLCRRRP